LTLKKRSCATRWPASSSIPKFRALSAFWNVTIGCAPARTTRSIGWSKYLKNVLAAKTLLRHPAADFRRRQRWARERDLDASKFQGFTFRVSRFRVSRFRGFRGYRLVDLPATY
jgi:hypothetical protein